MFAKVNIILDLYGIKRSVTKFEVINEAENCMGVLAEKFVRVLVQSVNPFYINMASTT